MTSYLIKDTTRQQREQIVRESLGMSDIGCDEASERMYEMYEPYIDGEKEIAEITASFRAHYVSGDQGPERSGGCDRY